jgi:pyruvate dehydrogenase (quinone)
MSEYLIEIIVKAGVKRIYAIAGDSLNPVNYSVVKDVILQWIYISMKINS